MDIARLSEKITIQKSEVQVDRIGNHSNTWTDYYRCHATVSGESQKETEVQDVGQTIDHDNLSFTIRYCSNTKGIDSTHYRVLFQEEVYDIKTVDCLGYRRKAIKLKCRKARNRNVS